MTGFEMFWPLLAHVLLVYILYGVLGLRRGKAVREGRMKKSGYRENRDEPPECLFVKNNLANQFELPVVFYALVVLLVATNKVTTIDIVAAWLFVAGRVIHTLVQTLTDNVPLRGQVFLINFAGVAVLAGHVALLALDGLWR